MTQTIAVLGAGGMGTGMANRLLDQGFRLQVWNRSADKLRPLTERGARAAATPAEAAAGADAVLVSLADAVAVENVLFGPDGACTRLPAGALVLDASTTSAEAAVAFGTAARDRGHRFVEARVLGNPEHAASGQLRVFAGGPEADFEAARPILEAIGKDVSRLGEWGAGAHIKIALNLFLGVQLAGLAEAVAIAEEAGLDRRTVLNVLGSGGYGSPVVAFRTKLLNADRLEPAAFRTDLMNKDLRLALELAAQGGLLAPVTSAAADGFGACVRAGLGHLDAAAIVRPGTAVPVAVAW